MISPTWIGSEATNLIQATAQPTETYPREAVDLLLGYPEGSAGRRMNLRYLAVREGSKVSPVLASVRESQLGDNDLDLVFMIDQQGIYRGFVHWGFWDRLLVRFASLWFNLKLAGYFRQPAPDLTTG